MADSQIATILIPCLVVQLNNQQYLGNNQVDNIIGQTLDVPCRNVIVDEVAYWATPIKDSGIFTKLQYQLVTDDNGAVPIPTFDSFQVIRVRDKLTEYTWWIYGSRDNFLNSCNTCCGAGTVPMPGIDGAFLPMIAPCQTLCDITNAQGQYQMIFGLPNLLGHEVFFPYGSYNNVALPTASGAGYSTVTLLLAYLNSTWSAVGTPSAGFVWTASADQKTLIVTGGFLSDSICVVVTTIGTSS